MGAGLVCIELWWKKFFVVSTCRKHTLPISPASAKPEALQKEVLTVNAQNVSVIRSHMTLVSGGQTGGIQSWPDNEYFSS